MVQFPLGGVIRPRGPALALLQAPSNQVCSAHTPAVSSSPKREPDLRCLHNKSMAELDGTPAASPAAVFHHTLFSLGPPSVTLAVLLLHCRSAPLLATPQIHAAAACFKLLPEHVDTVLQLPVCVKSSLCQVCVKWIGLTDRAFFSSPPCELLLPIGKN